MGVECISLTAANVVAIKICLLLQGPSSDRSSFGALGVRLCQHSCNLSFVQDWGCASYSPFSAWFFMRALSGVAVPWNGSTPSPFLQIDRMSGIFCRFRISLVLLSSLVVTDLKYPYRSRPCLEVL
jgi:hypothetical protein